MYQCVFSQLPLSEFLNFWSHQKTNKLQKCSGNSAHLGSNQGIRVEEVFPPVAVEQGALASVGKKRRFLHFCGSQLFSQPGRGGSGWFWWWGAVDRLHSMVKTSMLLSGPAGEERRVKEKLLSQSNLHVVSVEGSDLLFQWNKKGNREFVTGYADEGAVTVSNPGVLHAASAELVASSPCCLLCQAQAWEAEVAPAASLPLTAGGTPSAWHAFP